MIRRTLRIIFIVLVLGAAWLAWNKPDWIVAGPPDDFKFSAQVSALENVVQSAMPEKPVTNTVDNTSNETTPINKPQPEAAKPTPAPTSRPDDKAYDVTDDGFENRCYYLGPEYPGDVLYTTVIISGYDPSDHTTFPYKGDLDDHNAPATAAGSQAWCSANDPYKSER